MGILALLVLPLIVLPAVFNALLGSDASPRSSPPTPTTAPRTAEVVWSTTAHDLRPELEVAELETSLDGASDDSLPASEGGVWLAISGRPTGSDMVLHALDPDSGKVRWQRQLDGVLCATEAPKSGILCASVLGRDPTTGLGTRWRLHLIDPATGKDRLARDIDGWLTAVHRAGQSFVLLEQRQPSPHAVVRAYRADDLRPRWTRDLAGEPQHLAMFSEDRIINRTEPERPGLALDRPHFRDVGSSLVALWIGQATAFIDRDSGKLVMMPHCSRLVDDGARLWCNETDGASSYSYGGERLQRIRGPRLAFPDDDNLGTDRNRPVFINDQGAGVAVNRATGEIGDVYTPPGAGTAFGMVTMPSAATMGAHTFLIGSAGTMLIDPKRDRTVWRNPDITISGLPIPVRDRVLVGYRTLDLVEIGTGSSTAKIRFGSTYTVAVGDRIAATGLDELSLVRVPS